MTTAIQYKNIVIKLRQIFYLILGTRAEEQSHIKLNKLMLELICQTREKTYQVRKFSQKLNGLFLYNPCHVLQILLFWSMYDF